MGFYRLADLPYCIGEEMDETRKIEIREVSADELKAMDEAARARELEAFAADPSIQMPLAGYAKGSVVSW